MSVNNVIKKKVAKKPRPAIVMRSAYSDSILAQHEFNDELQIWKTLNNKNNNNIERQRFASHLSQKYLCDRLDKLESSEAVSKIRKEVAKQMAKEHAEKFTQTSS